MVYQPLVRNGDFVRAYKKGKSYVHPLLVLYVNKNRVKKTRVGITATKKVGNAVQRNRARRIIRHGLYQKLPQNIGGYDLVFVARGQTITSNSDKMAEVIDKLFKKAGLPLIEVINDEKNNN